MLYCGTFVFPELDMDERSIVSMEYVVTIIKKHVCESVERNSQGFKVSPYISDNLFHLFKVSLYISDTLFHLFRCSLSFASFKKLCKYVSSKTRMFDQMRHKFEISWRSCGIEMKSGILLCKKTQLTGLKSRLKQKRVF